MYTHATQVNPLSQQKQYIAYDNKMHIPRKSWSTSFGVGIECMLNSSVNIKINFYTSGSDINYIIWGLGPPARVSEYCCCLKTNYLFYMIARHVAHSAHLNDVCIAPFDAQLLKELYPGLLLSGDLVVLVRGTLWHWRLPWQTTIDNK